MTRFSKLTLDDNGKPVETDIREIPQSAMAACPHCIMVAEHYRSDNTCRCNDPNHDEMRDWGYEWSEDTQTWEAGTYEEEVDPEHEV